MQQQPETFSVADRVCTVIILALPARSSLELDGGVSIWQRSVRPTEHHIKVWSGGRGVLVDVSNLDPKSDGPEFAIFRLDDSDKSDPLFHLLNLEDLVKCLQTALDMVSLWMSPKRSPTPPSRRARSWICA